jgi:hypothetical protein
LRRDASDKNTIHEYVGRISDALGDARLQGSVEQVAAHLPGAGAPLDRVRSLLDANLEALQSSGGGGDLPYLSRSPFVSLVQSHVEEARGDGHHADPSHPESLWSRIVHSFEDLVHSVEDHLHIHPGDFGPNDPDWYVYIAKGVLDRLAAGTHPFNPDPAEFDELTDDARLVVVGDWGTGLPRARAVADHMRQAVHEALAAGRQVHVIHLGDVYYSGLESEDQRRFLDPWPVAPHQADQVRSWSLNGNHDMYSGGFGYFNTLLADPRFAAQRDSAGKSTSYFRLRSPSWDFVGLDTAWDPDITSTGAVAVLPDPQGEYVARVAAESDRKLVLFSHHQLVSVYDRSDLGPTLPGKLRPVLEGNRVTAWWWGHEHRAITYEAAAGVRYPRCLGNGGVPVTPDPAPPHAHGDPVVTWHSTRALEEEGQQRTRYGFAVLDLTPDKITTQYIDDDGHVAYREVLDAD